MKRIGALAALALTACLAGCPGKNSTEPLPVGQIVPMSGPGEFAGERARHGVELAVADLNKEDKRGGQRPVLVQHADGRNAAATATRLTKVDRVLALLDDTDPSQALGVAAAATAAETPLLTTSPLGRTPANEYSFSLVAAPSYQGTVMARFAREELKLETVVALSDARIPACAELTDAFAQEFTRKGGRVGPGPGAFDKDEDLADRLEQIKKATPSGVLFAGSSRHLGKVAATLHESSATTPLLFAGDESALLALATAPAAGKVHVGTAFAAEGLTPAGQELAKAYKERFGQELDVHAALAVDGIRLLADALRKSKAAGPGARKELAGVEEFDSLTGPLSFNREGCARRPVFVVTAEGGKVSLAKKYDAEPK